MGSNKKMSIRKKLKTFVLAVFITSLISVILCIIVTMHLKTNNDRMLNSIAELSDFYSDVEAMDGYARDYVSSGNEGSFIQYESYQDSARNNLEDIRRTFLGEVSLRLGFLRNMLDTYDEALQNYGKDPDNWYITYQLLNYDEKLIQDTSQQYQKLIVSDMRKQMKNEQSIWIVQITVSVCMLILMVLLSARLLNYFAKEISNPITQLVDNIHSIQSGNYDIAKREMDLEEIRVIFNAFSDMAIKIKNNIELLKYNAELNRKLLEQENETLTIRNSFYQSELKNLQAQINPHFLFNTLNMIAKRSILNGDNETGLLMEKTTSLLRYGLDKANKISTWTEELSCIKNYFFIQQHRFEGRVLFELDVEPDIPDIQMPAMVLQPIVENSVMHGIKDMVDQAEIILKAHCFEEHLHIHIEDNGNGIPSEKLEALLASLKAYDTSADNSKRNHIGLKNVYQRLMMFYGSDLCFSIESDVDCGTIVTLEIPLETVENNEV